MQPTTPLGDLLASPRYLPRLTENDTKPIQRALAGATLFDDGVSLDGVVVEAAYAVAEPEVLDHLREQRVPVLIDPQSLRLSTPAYMSNTRLGSLPYLPSAPLTPSSSASDRDHFVADALRFQQKVGRPTTWCRASRCVTTRVGRSCTTTSRLERRVPTAVRWTAASWWGCSPRARQP
jgi:hypothetical protein